MALLPYALRPSFIIRSRAIRRGILGNSMLWKGVAVVVFGRRFLRAFFGKRPEPLGAWNVESDGFVNVLKAAPVTKRGLLKAGVSKKMLRHAIIEQAVADARAKDPEAKIIVKTK